MLCNRVLNSNRIFQIFNTKWSYDKMLILTELGRAGRENIWLSVRTCGPRADPPTQSIRACYQNGLSHRLEFYLRNTHETLC